MFPDFCRAASSLCFLWQCKIVWTIGEKGSMCKEPIAALRLEMQSMFWPANPGTVIGTQNNKPVPNIAVEWRAKKDLLEVMTGRT